MLEKPDEVGILACCNKSLVFFSYKSIFPEIKLLFKVKSNPKLSCSVVSQVKFGLARFNRTIGTLAPPPAFPYNLSDTP